MGHQSDTLARTPSLNAAVTYDRAVERTDVTFNSHGDTIAAWFWHPGGEGRQPCVVLGHGFSGTRRDGLEAFAERFAAAGLAALAFDYRYFGDSTGEPRQVLDIKRQLEDWQAAIAYVRSRDDVDPDRVAVWGSSFAGGHAITTAARDPRLAAAIAQAPFTDGLVQLKITPPLTGARLTALGIRDQIAAWRGRPPVLIAPTGPPGSLAVMTSPDAHPGFAAIIPPDSKWRGEVGARIMLQVSPLPAHPQRGQGALPAADVRLRRGSGDAARARNQGGAGGAEGRAAPLPDRTLRDLRRAARLRGRGVRPGRLPSPPPARSPAGGRGAARRDHRLRKLATSRRGT